MVEVENMKDKSKKTTGKKKESPVKVEVVTAPAVFEEKIYEHEFKVENKNATEKKIAENLVAGVKKSLDSYCYIGYWLVQARHIDFKKSKYYKNWEEFLANTCGFSRKTADNYMLVFKHFAEKDENGNSLPKISDEYKGCNFTELVNMARKNNAALPELSSYKDIQTEEAKKKAKEEKETNLKDSQEEELEEELEEKGSTSISYEFLNLPLQITAKGLSLSAPAKKNYKPFEKEFGKIDFTSSDWCKKLQDSGYTLELSIRKTEAATVEGVPDEQSEAQMELADIMNAPEQEVELETPEEKAV